MKKEKMIHEVDSFDKCPNCNSQIYRGRLNSKWGTFFYYRTKHKDIRDRHGRPVIFEEIVRIGTPTTAVFKNAAICRHCLFLFFKATHYEPTRRGFEERFGITKAELQKKVKEESRVDLKFDICPLCNNKLDKGELFDRPPGGFMPGCTFKIKFDRKIKGKKEEKVIVAQDFLSHFFESYFCDSCFTAIGRMEKYFPFSEDYWDIFESPSKQIVRCLEERLKNLPSEETVVKEEDAEEDFEKLDEEIEEIISNDSKPKLEIDFENNSKLTEEIDFEEEPITDRKTEAKLHYEYFPSIKNCLDTPKKYWFCPSCGIENSEDREQCRGCSWEVKLEKTICPHCENKINKIGSYCPKCGKNVDEK
jgi:hypothetical protein